MKPLGRGIALSLLLAPLILAVSGCVFATPYGGTLVSPITAMKELFSGDGSDAEPGPTHWDHR
jgi:hypothetical protein